VILDGESHEDGSGDERRQARLNLRRQVRCSIGLVEGLRVVDLPADDLVASAASTKNDSVAVRLLGSPIANGTVDSTPTRRKFMASR
jgi:hypothetical protein